MRAVAERFVLRGTTPTQRGAKTDGVAINFQLATKRIGTGFPNAGEVDRRCSLIVRTVGAVILNRAGGTGMRNFNDALDFHCIGVQPGTLHVGEKHIGRAGYAETCVDAAFGFEQQVEFFAGGGFDAIGDC